MTRIDCVDAAELDYERVGLPDLARHQKLTRSTATLAIAAVALIRSEST